MSNPYRPDDDSSASYGQPSYGPPSYGEPSYGQPSYDAPSLQDASTGPAYGAPSPYATSPSSSSPYATGPYASSAPQQNQLALIALICSLAGVITGVSVFAGIVCGHIALTQLKQNPQQSGRGLAVAALWVGYGLLALFVAAIVLWFAVIVSMVGSGIY